MEYLPILFIAWGVVVACLLALLAYNATITRDEEDQLFLADSNEIEHRHQDEILLKVKKVRPYIRVFGSLSALMTLGLAGIFGWDAWLRLR
jgi:hypothetical protein